MAQENIDTHLTGVLLAYAYPERIARQRHNNESRYLLSNGKGAYIPDYLLEQSPEYLVIASLDEKQGDAIIYLASEIHEQLILEFRFLSEN